MKRKTLLLSSSSCSSSCSVNRKKLKIPDKINLMAPKITDPNWPPLLEEKLLHVLITAAGNGGNSRDSAYWQEAVAEVNCHIEENFPHLQRRDAASLRQRLSYLRRTYKRQGNTAITPLCEKLFQFHQMVIPKTIPVSSPQYSHSFGRGQSSPQYGFGSGQFSPQYSHSFGSGQFSPQYSHSFGSGQSSGGGPSGSSGRGGPIRRRRLTTNHFDMAGPSTPISESVNDVSDPLAEFMQNLHRMNVEQDTLFELVEKTPPHQKKIFNQCPSMLKNGYLQKLQRDYGKR